MISLFDLNKINFGRTVIDTITGRLATNTNKLISDKNSGFIIAKKEKLKIIPVRGNEIFFLNTRRVPTAKKIDEIRRSNCSEPVILQ